MPNPVNTNDFTANLKPAQDGTAILHRERCSSNIDVLFLSEWLLGSDFLDRQKRVVSLLEKEAVFSKINQLNLSREDRYMLGLARAKMLRRMADKYLWADADYDMAFYLVDEMSPYALHTSMFAVTLHEQLSDEQKQYWLPLWKEWQIIGAYAQTELGHGSDVRRIELEARWDPSKREFVLHSPTLTSCKFWNGSLGRTATHAVVVAQLLLPDGPSNVYRSYGPHTFIAQIRDLKTHQPLKGIAVGDIGPKYGYASMDNGYMLFDQYRLPHSAMCARYSRVDPNTGEYHKPKNSKVVYGSLTATRKDIIMQARLVLARAVTIAVRYTAIRVQFADRDSGLEQEIPVLDYPTVQMRVLPLLATTYALHFCGQMMGNVYEKTRHDVGKGNFETLNDMHSLSAGLKSLCTTLAADGIEVCRRALGGHGFSGASGLVGINSNYLSKPTVEGDNWMITQQLARYLVKLAKRVLNKTGGMIQNSTVDNLIRYRCEKDQQVTLDLIHNDKDIVRAFDDRAAYLTFLAFDILEVQKKSWNSQLVLLYKLSKAHSEAVLVHNFYNGLFEDKSLQVSTKAVLWKMFRLFSFTTIDTNSREFLKARSVSDGQLDEIPGLILKLMKDVRPHAVRLVDSWAIPDYLLDSALGRYDGRVYEDLFHRAHRLNPINKITVNPSYRSDEIILGSNDGGAILAKL